MRIFGNRFKYSDSSDAALVMASLGGDCDSFGVIVTRYQSLLCSLAYSAVGDLKHSEDIAQEAFIEAWRKLDTLREPEKLKAWLCGILRFKVTRYLRKEANQPIKGAGELDEHVDSESGQPDIENAAIHEQEQTLLWKTLEQLPEAYREPLILFYRESQSVENVASELELSEAAVKQRMSRGRKMLQEAMVSFVEDALEKSKPGALFTTAVIAAITSVAPPTKAAAFGAGAMKAGSYFKWTSLLAILASFSGLVSFFFGVKASLAQTRTTRERRTTIKTAALFFLAAFIYVVGMFALRQVALGDSEHAVYYALASQTLVLAFVGTYFVLLVGMLVSLPKVRAQERKSHPDAFSAEVDQIGSKHREYRSQLCLLGAPLVHFKLSAAEEGDKPAFGWIAGGDRAYGLLFAWGGFAMAPISVGIVSVGLVSVGAVGLGLFAMGTVAIGLIGFGASTVAYKAYGSLSALGWESAFSNGFSVAKEAALGPLPFARHINSEQAAEIANLATLDQTYFWLLSTITVLVIVPAAWHSKQVLRRMGKKPRANDISARREEG